MRTLGKWASPASGCLHGEIFIPSTTQDAAYERREHNFYIVDSSFLVTEVHILSKIIVESRPVEIWLNWRGVGCELVSLALIAQLLFIRQF